MALDAAKLKAQAEKVIIKLLKNVDDPVAEYVVNVVCETPKVIRDEALLFAVIGDLLIAYDVAADEADARSVCRKMQKELSNVTGIKPVDAKDAKDVKAADAKDVKGAGDEKDLKMAGASAAAAADAKSAAAKVHAAAQDAWELGSDANRHAFREGMHVQARYADGNWYEATIDRVKGDNFVITFVGYGDEEEVPVTGMRVKRLDSGGEEFQVKLLSAPIRIADFGVVVKRDEDEEDRKTTAAAAAKDEAKKGPSKKELRKLKEEKKKADMLIRKEKERRARAKAIKMNAVATYLASDQKRSKEVAIDLFSLHTPDGSQELLLDQALRFVPGRRYGLIGRNGAGKTSLLRAIATYDIPGFPTHLRVIHVEQEVKGTNTSILERVLKADVERTMLLAEEKKLLALVDEKEKALKDEKKPLDAAAKLTTENESKAATKRLEKVYARMKEIDAWTAESRAASILSGLGFAVDKQQRPTKELSGGWRMRVALACALFVHPDLLLLDEPTNHLDFPAVLWLEDYLRKYKNTLILVSHDRHFVNNVITDVVHLHQRQLLYYRGDYDTYEKVRIEKMQAQKKQFEAQKLKREHVQKFIDKFRYNAKRAALVQSRIKSLARMELLEDVIEDPAFHFEFPDPEPLQQSAVVCVGVTFGYSRDKILMTDVHCNIDSNSRIGVLGANGVGKSTLIKLLTGEIEPIEGKIQRNASARIAVFAQHHMDQLKLNMSPLDLMMEAFPKNHPQVMRRHLGLFGVTGDMALQRIEYLSGGQKSRVAFAMVTWKKPHIIIMDEPTNHLDLETIDALILAINGFGGGVLLVSHDQHFLSHVGQEFWGLGNGKVKRFDDFEATKKFSYGETKFNA